MLGHEIKLNADGFAYLDLNIKPNHLPEMVKVCYKVDTGANCTTISCTELEKLGYGNDWIKAGKLLQGEERPTTATGLPINDCYLVTLPEINIGDWVGYNWPFMTSLSVRFKHLLGTNSMSFFNWHFNYEWGVCNFNLISGKRKLTFNASEQTIHAIDDVK